MKVTGSLFLSRFAIIMGLGMPCATRAAEPVLSLNLLTTSGKPVQIPTTGAPATVVLFLSAVCPMSGDYAQRIASMQTRPENRLVRFVLVNSNENESNEEVERHAALSGVHGPVLRDPAARAAGILGANATPTAIVLDSSGQIRYWGAIDDSRSPQRVRRRYLESAIESLLAGTPVTVSRTKAMGCTIKNSSN